MKMDTCRVIDTTGRTEYPPDARACIAGLPIRMEAVEAVEPRDLIARCGDADVLMVTAAFITREVIARLPRLRAVIRYGIGLDRIDVRAAEERGVAVRNTVGFCTEEMADHTLALLLACARDLLPDVLAVRSGAWSRGGSRPLHRLHGGHAGIIGLGAIGKAVARRLKALGMRILAFDPHGDTKAFADLGAERTDLDDLLSRADVISVHCPLTEETRGMLGRDQFARCRPGALFVNTARGGVLDEDALLDALRSGRLAAAGLDVLASDPPPPDHPLRALPNVVITPHVAWYSEEAEAEVYVRAFQTLAEFVRASLPTPIDPTGPSAR